MKFTLTYKESTTNTILTEQYTNQPELTKRVFALIDDIKPEDITILNEAGTDVTHYFIDIKEK